MRSSSLQANDVSDVLVSRCFLFVGAFPPGHIPNFKTTASPHERDFTFQSAHAGEFLRRHDEEKLILGVRQKNKFFSTLSAPARGDGDAIFFVESVTKFAGVEGLS